MNHRCLIRSSFFEHYSFPCSHLSECHFIIGYITCELSGSTWGISQNQFLSNLREDYRFMLPTKMWVALLSMLVKHDWLRIPKVYDSGTATLQDTFPGIFGLHALREVWYVLWHLETIRVLISILIAGLSCKLLRTCASGFCEYYIYHALISRILKLQVAAGTG